jgi:hypothetical protein
MSSALKITFLATISLMLMFTPLAFEIDLGEEALAMSGGGGGSDGNRSSGPISSQYTATDPDSAPIPNPEPGTLLLFGAGAVGLAALKKKFRKK